MSDLLKELLGKHVELRSQSERDWRDDGILQDYDERWIKLRKSSGDTIYFPIVNVRLVKPLE